MIMQTQTNSRNYTEHFIEGQHVRLNDLRSIAERQGLENQYLYKEDVPEYPRPEFYVSHLKHDTERRGLRGIWKDRGFKDPRGCSSDPRHLSLVWWSLAVGPEEIQAAETRLLEETYPDRMEEQAAEQESFLWKFASSPAFKRRSRLGSYRFRFPLEEVLTAYSEQFCSGAPPIMRVFKTSLYKQEVQYSVLVHSPANQRFFSRFPLLPDDDPDAVCTYRDGRFIWRPEAMCKTHSYELIRGPDENQMDAWGPMRHPEFYVWDHVAVALHMENRQVLRFDPDQLRENLRFCWRDNRTIIPQTHFDHFCRAHSLLRRLWPRYSRLEKEPPLPPT